MSKLNIACLLSPMADTEGPMEIAGSNVLKGAKKIMGKYGEVGLEATITFAEENPDTIHTDILSIGHEKELTSLQQNAVAMIQPKKHPGSLGVHAVNDGDIDQRDAFEVADLLVALINKLENKPHIIFAGRESWDYSHGVVGPAVAQKLGMPYYSGVNEVKLNDGMDSVTATFIEGNDKVVVNVPLPAVFGTTDWLNGKDSARFTSLKGVMAAKKFKRNTMSVADLGASATKRTSIESIEVVKSERKNHVISEGEGPDKVKAALELLVNKDKALSLDSSGGDGSSAASIDANWQDADAGSLNLADDVVLIGEHDGSKVRLATHQALGQARKVADATGKKVSLVLFAENVDGLAASAVGYGADRVIGIASDTFKHPTVEIYYKHLSQLLNGVPAYFMTIASDLGRDLAAFFAAAHDGGLLQDAAELSIDGGSLKAKRIVSNARFITTEKIEAGVATQVVSVRASAFDPVADDRNVTFNKVAIAAPALNASVKEVIKGEKTQGIPLPEARIIVSGGRGMKAAENFDKLNELADQLGAAVGASRAVTDLEWVPHNLQIGQTGTTVAPDVYFAIGISGAIQHLTGMLGSKYVVAVNPDADAPIHKHADISIIDKWENIVPALTDAVKK